MSSLRNIRLYTENNISSGSSFELSEKQSHYLSNVMRCKSGDRIQCFNEVSGEYLCEITACDKKKTVLTAQACLKKPYTATSDVWLVFAPLKKERTDFVIEKAVELGVSKIIPVITRHTNCERVKTERLVAQAVEAAEQCGRLSIPEILPLTELSEVISLFDLKRKLFFMDERRQGVSAVEAFAKSQGRPAALLIGPEGGFSDEEAEMLNNLKFVTNISLGPRILRAETAALAALALWQAISGDWYGSK